MSLLKARVSSLARVAANRRNARKSIGPRSARGKAQSGLNRLRNGSRSRLYQDLMWKLMDAPPGAVARTARAAMTRELAAHPLFAELAQILCQAEVEVALARRAYREERNSQKDCFLYERSHQVYENKEAEVLNEPKTKLKWSGFWCQNTQNEHAQRAICVHTKGSSALGRPEYGAQSEFP